MAKMPKKMPNASLGNHTALGCMACIFRDACGGIAVEEADWDCFRRCREKCSENDCDYVCPFRHDFASRMHEVGGLREPKDINTICSPEGILPLYVPLIGHQYKRSKILSRKVVALSSFQLLRRRNNNYGTSTQNAEDLRRLYNLSPDADVLLVSVAKDRALETYWRYRRLYEVPEQLSRVSVFGMTVPNYSLFLDAPRTHWLFNRARMLVSAEELSGAGVGTILHLNASSQADWDYWVELLQRQTHIRYVCKEFQTGLLRLEAGRRAINALTSLQERVGRKIHPVVVGAARYLPELSREFERFTLVDSVPFQATVHRKLLTPRDGKRPVWRKRPTEPTELLDELLDANLIRYDEWLCERLGRATIDDEVDGIRSRSVQRGRPSDLKVANPFQMALPIKG